MCTTVQIKLDIRIHEPNTLMAYARMMCRDWGFDAGHFDAMTPDTLAEAAREAVILNECNPQGVGIEIVDSSFT